MLFKLTGSVLLKARYGLQHENMDYNKMLHVNYNFKTTHFALKSKMYDMCSGI